MGHTVSIKTHVRLNQPNEQGSPPRFIMVDCVGYPYLVFSRQCQVYPYNSPTPSLASPFSTMVVLHNIAHTQVSETVSLTPFSSLLSLFCICWVL